MLFVRLDGELVRVYCRLLLNYVHMKSVTKKEENVQGSSGDVCCLRSDSKRVSNPKLLQFAVVNFPTTALHLVQSCSHVPSML
jgi:hypothetical protein